MKYFTLSLCLILITSCHDDHAEHKGHDHGAAHALQKTSSDDHEHGEKCHHNQDDGHHHGHGHHHGDHGHHHGPGGHTHGDYEVKAPNGGTLVKLGGDAAVLEVLVDKNTGLMTVYFYDGEAKEQLTLDQKELNLELNNNTITLKADDNGVFTTTSDLLKGLDKFDAQVGELEVEGLPFDGITVPYPEGN
jgi:hypothetical protein